MFRVLFTGFERYENRLKAQGCPVPQRVNNAVGELFNALEASVNAITDRMEGEPPSSDDRTAARYAAERRRFPRFSRVHARIAPGARLPAIQQRYMPGVYRIVHRRILAALEKYPGSPLTYRGRRIVNVFESEAATAPSVWTYSRRPLCAWSIPCGGRPRPPRSSGKPDRGPKASLDNAAIFALARATHSNSIPFFDSSIMLLLSIRSRPIALAAATLMVKGASWPLITNGTTGTRERDTAPAGADAAPTPTADPAVTVEVVPLDTLTPLTDNPRTHTSRGIDFLKASLGRVGAARSGVIDEERTILAGNGMQDAATQVGYREAVVVTTDGTRPVFVQRTGLSTTQKVRLIVDDNRASELSAWNPTLATYADQDPSLKADWTRPEWRAAVGRDAPTAGRTDPDATPAARSTPIRLGDQFRLQAHVVRCGDSTDPAHVERPAGWGHAASDAHRPAVWRQLRAGMARARGWGSVPCRRAGGE